VTDNDQNLSFDLHVADAKAVLGVEGEIDPHTARELDEALGELVRREDLEQVVLDLAAIGFIDSSGLRVILAADADLRARGATLTVRSPSDAVRRLLEITDLLTHLDVE
jgi:stage II sporulation protein AA (anti-sigma F factor antagonist)